MRAKRFHGVSAGNAHECSLRSRIRKVSYEQIAPILDGVTDVQGWGDVLGLINEHEGRLIFLVHNTCYELAQKLARLDADSLKSVTDYAENRLNMVREALNRLRDLSNSILGLSGRSGLLELTSSRDTRESIASILINQGSVVMSRDEYKVGQAGAVGPGAHAHDITFNQIWNESGSKIDTKQLASELTQLRSALTKEAAEPDHFVALGEVAAAEKAATADDGPTALQHLKKAGSWVWDVGTKVGIGVAITSAKTALGI